MLAEASIGARIRQGAPSRAQSGDGSRYSAVATQLFCALRHPRDLRQFSPHYVRVVSVATASSRCSRLRPRWFACANRSLAPCLKNQCSFKHSSRSRPLKLSTMAFVSGIAGATEIKRHFVLVGPFVHRFADELAAVIASARFA
jgi:hypothetical protein